VFLLCRAAASFNKAIKSDKKQLAFVRASQSIANYFLPLIAALTRTFTFGKKNENY
jgi:hypothetical protein